MNFATTSGSGSAQRGGQATGRLRVLSPGLVAGFILIVAVLIATWIVSTRHIRNIYDANESVTRTYSVKAALRYLLITLVDAETGERGFIITGEASYLEPYDRALVAVSSAVVQVRALTADNPEQQADLNLVLNLAPVKIRELAEAIRQRRDLGFAAAQAVVTSNVGKHTMDEIRAIIARVEAREDVLLARRTMDSAQSYHAALVSELATTGLALLVVVALFFSTRRAGKERLDAAHTAQRLRVTLGSIGDAVIATDNEGFVTRMNAVAESLTGWTEADAAGQRLEDVFVIVNEASRLPVENPVKRVLRENTIVGLANHTVLISKDGREIPIDDSAAPIKTEDGVASGVVLVFRDVSERRRVERDRATELADMKRLYELSARLLKEDEVTAILRHTLEASIELLGADKGNAQLYDENEKALKMAAHVGFNSEFLERFKSVGAGFSIYGTALIRREWLIVEDVFADPACADLAPIYASHGFVAVQSLPLINRDGTVFGMLSTHFPNPHRPTDRELRLMALHGQLAERVIERLRADEATRRAKGEAERANRVKDEFLAVLSHELRTPLTSILGWTSVLKSGELPEKSRYALQAIERSAQAEAQLIESLLDLSRIMAGKLHLEMERLDLRSVVNAAVDTVRPAADTKEVGIHVLVPLSPIFIHGDATRLQQVVWNLLTNAVKFTPKHGRVEVILERADSHAQIQVKDNGQGIRPEFLPYIFDRFAQDEGRGARVHIGLGLGLGIVRELLQAHGGTIGAESPGEGQGSTFLVRLPCDK